METETIPKKKEELKDLYVEEEEDEGPPPCGIMGRYPVVTVMLFAAVGIAIGLGLSYWEPEDIDTKEKIVKWVGLIGDLFIRALKCVVLPLVFVNVILSVVDMVSLGRASSVGVSTIVLYLGTTVIASIIGIISIFCFKGLFTEGTFTDPGPATITLGCDIDGYLLAEMPDGSVTCSNSSSSASAFTIVDISKTFARVSSGARNDISLSDTVYDGVFTKIVSSNIVESFVEANFAAVVAFAIVFGVALAQSMHKARVEGEYTLLIFFKHLNACLLAIINWIILVTPFAVLSLIANAIGSQTNLSAAFANVGYLVVATLLAMVAHYLLVYVLGYYLLAKKNPFEYLKHIIPAQTTAFASASSAATIPVTIKSVKNSGMVPDQIANFVIPLGATINMDGGAIYFPCACIWLAALNGEKVTVANCFLLVILATVGSAGTAPVPSASLVLIITAYNTVFGSTGTPDGFSFILAIDWFMDRWRTTLNVTGDAVVCGIISARNELPSNEEEYPLGNKKDLMGGEEAEGPFVSREA